MSLRGRAAIVGIGELRPTRHTEGETTIGMLTKAGLVAIEDSGLPFDEIDGLLVHPSAVKQTGHGVAPNLRARRHGST